MRVLLPIFTSLCLGAACQAASASDQGEQDVQTVRIQHVEMKGKPPFKRSTEVLEVSDAAALEDAGEQQDKSLKGRPPYARQR